MYRRPAPTVAQRAAAIEHLDLALMHLSRYRAKLLQPGSGLNKRAGDNRLDLANRVFSQLLEVRGARVARLRKMSHVDSVTLAKMASGDRVAASMARSYLVARSDAKLRGIVR